MLFKLLRRLKLLNNELRNLCSFIFLNIYERDLNETHRRNVGFEFWLKEKEKKISRDASIECYLTNISVSMQRIILLFLQISRISPISDIFDIYFFRISYWIIFDKILL